MYRPFVEARAEFHHMNMMNEIGFAADSQNEFKCRPCIHMDVFRYYCWYNNMDYCNIDGLKEIAIYLLVVRILKQLQK